MMKMRRREEDAKKTHVRENEREQVKAKGDRSSLGGVQLQGAH